ncbi:MAG: tRNA pseudouridine(38-40) synthase TruA, partial [Candidatus Omnitrophota bacterium]|nr:tRNA pseudouridine(38-40) synthase TruA [Candidatus Omnitrophota bacterium]
EYDGTAYAGWQVQNRHRGKTIQQVIEKALCKILQEKVWLNASGRTDAGVHALAQIANFKTNSEIPGLRLRAALNSLLPADISVSTVEDVHPDFHSRFSAKSKVYCYRLLNRVYPSALSRGRVYFCPYSLDFDLMRREAACLSGRHDFSAFCASGSDVKNKIRTIKHISLKKRRGSVIELEIEADGFLYNMCRNIAGTLVEIGRGKFARGAIKKILRSKDRRLAGPTAPAEGLYLVKVKY